MPVLLLVLVLINQYSDSYSCNNQVLVLGLVLTHIASTHTCTRTRKSGTRPSPADYPGPQCQWSYPEGYMDKLIDTTATTKNESRAVGTYMHCHERTRCNICSPAGVHCLLCICTCVCVVEIIMYMFLLVLIMIRSAGQHATINLP